MSEPGKLRHNLLTPRRKVALAELLISVESSTSTSESPLICARCVCMLLNEVRNRFQSLRDFSRGIYGIEGFRSQPLGWVILSFAVRVKLIRSRYLQRFVASLSEFYSRNG